MDAGFEADLARMRTREGMKAAKAKGRLRGKRPKLSPKREAHLVDLHRAGVHTIGELEELFSVTRSTVYRAIERRPGSSASARRPGVGPLVTVAPPWDCAVPEVPASCGHFP